MAKRGAPLDDSGALFLCFLVEKNKEKSLKTGKRMFAYTEKTI